MSKIHIHSPAFVRARLIRYCPFCKKRRRIIAILREWYDPDFYCGGCGARRDADGWKKQRKNVREYSINYVKEHWPGSVSMKAAVKQLLEDM